MGVKKDVDMAGKKINVQYVDSGIVKARIKLQYMNILELNSMLLHLYDCR